MSESRAPGLRITQFDNPLKKDLLLRSLTAKDNLGRLFQFDFELSSEKRDIKLEGLLGKTMMVSVEIDGHTRHLHGYINRFSMVRSEERYDVYHASVVPWLWFLTRTSDSRIFQNKSVPEIIKEVCQDNGFTDISDSGLSGTYRKLEYCVQYRETDFNFVSRLMEQEGIYYFFKHEKGKHTLMMADSSAAHSAAPGCEKVPFFPPANDAQRERDHLSAWTCSKQIMTGAYVLNDYNFETPQADLKTKLTWNAGHDKDDLEFYDYPAEYTKKAEGEPYVRARLEEQAAEHEQFSGSGDVVGLSAGVLFTLTDYPREDMNRKYLVVATEYRFDRGEHWSGTNSEDAVEVDCSVQAIDSTRPYRSPRITPKPVVQGPQTAVVVGPGDEGIHTDKYGRVKVQFFWDRLGKRDDASSCWVRVAHVWAGKQWGGIHIPRIKQEVIVEFIEGDPDQPIITGAVYNADNMPPYALPDNKTQSGVKSRSTPNGGSDTFNEIRFEDKVNEEHIFMQAQRDMNVDIKYARAMRIGYENSDGGDVDTTDITGGRKVTISEMDTLEITKDHEVSVEGNQKTGVKKDQQVDVSGAQKIDVSGAQKISVNGAVAYVSKQKIELKVGSNSIVIDNTGIKIKGMQVSINGDVKAELKGGAMVKIQGGITMIN